MKKLFCYIKSRLILSLICGLIVGMVVTGKCCAIVTTKELSINCNRIKLYPGHPDTQLSLVTQGIRIVATDGLITDCGSIAGSYLDPSIYHDLNEIAVTAGCVEYDYGERRDADIISIHMWPKSSSSSLVCKKGEGIEIMVHAPERCNEVYRYVATLSINQDDLDKTSSLSAKNVTEKTSTKSKPSFAPSFDAPLNSYDGLSQI